MIENDSRQADFMNCQKEWGIGKRVEACGREGFILEYDIEPTFPLSGIFAIFYDDGDFRRYDAVFLRYTRGTMDPREPAFLRRREVVEEAYQKFCENLFLSNAA